MSVLIKNMEMPKNCDVCPLITETNDYHVCNINEQFIPWEWIDEHSAEQRHPKPSWCPLVSVPTHGRLIDADALYRTIDATSERTIGHTTFKETVLLDIRGMPTILESTMGQLFSDEAINEAEREE